MKKEDILKKTITIVVSFIFGVAASIAASLLYNNLPELLPSLFAPEIKRWDGKWIGMAEDILIPNENDLDGIGLKQDIKLEVFYIDRDSVKIKGIIIPYLNNGELYSNAKSYIEGTGKIYDGNYMTFSYKLSLEKSFGVGVGLLRLSPEGKRAEGHFLSRRITNSLKNKATRAFGRVSLDFNESDKN